MISEKFARVDWWAVTEGPQCRDAAVLLAWLETGTRGVAMARPAVLGNAGDDWIRPRGEGCAVVPGGLWIALGFLLAA